jgi:hypothetical protein
LIQNKVFLTKVTPPSWRGDSRYLVGFVMILDDAASQKFFDHWKRLISSGVMPSLHDFLGVPNPELQPNVIILDVLSESDVRIRLMGTAIVQLIGRELTKTNSLDVYADHLRPVVGRACMTMVAQPCGQFTRRMVNTAGGLLMPASSVALPLANKSGTGCIAAFTHTNDPVTAGDSMIVIHDIVSSHWIDIGAGVPDDKL